MGKVVEKSKKKKKGRPSLLDLQKRTLKEQQQQQQQQEHQQLKQIKNRNLSNSNSNNSAVHSSHNYNSATPTPLRRSTRRNPTPSSPEHDDDDDDAVELNGKRREKKLKLVLKLPSSQKSEPDSASLNSNGSESKGEEDKAKASYHKRRKINAIGGGSGFGLSEKGGKPVAGANPTNNVQDSGPSTPVPDKKLLLFILDRLQKKDTYGVFSEPVDPNELPDYHEVIEHPMDFGTVRKKLSSGVYTSLEQFEKDIFLICSNAMQYNAPDTIYFRQARSIQELAKKNFENLRQDSDDNEPEPKIVRRGRPPTKNFKKPVGRPSLEHAASAVALDGTLATAGESIIWSNNDLRKGPHVLDKSSLPDSYGRSHGSRNDGHLLTDNKFEKNDEGSMFKGNSMKHRKRQFVLDENRRNTYSQLSAGGREPSVLATFDAERKQLMAVGLLSEHGYARSLARFAANIGTIAWKISLKKIERSLPSGVMFGPGWVGENDIPPQRALLFPSNPQGLPSPSRLRRLPKDSCAVVASCSVELREKLSEKPENNASKNDIPQIHSASEAPQLTNDLSLSASTSAPHAAASKSEPCMEREAAVEGFNSHGGFNILNSNTSMTRPRPPFQIHQSHQVHPGMNGFNGAYRFSLPAQMGKLVGAARLGTNFRPSLTDRVSTTNTNFVHASTENSLNSKNPKPSENSSAINSSGALPNSGNEEKVAPRSGHESRPSWQGSSPQPKPDSGLSTQQKSDSVPPDLNVRFQFPGSPSSSHVDSAQPDLALQL